MADENIIGERLRACRQGMQANQTKIAELLGVQRQIISYYESGARKPNLEDIQKLADLYGVTVDYLLGRTDVATPNIEIQAICDYTGLSEQAVEALNELKDLCSLPQTVCALLEDEYSKYLSELYSDNYARLYYGVLGRIDSFLNMHITDKELCVSKSGKLVDYKSTDKAYIQKELSEVEDIMALKTIKVDDIAQRVLLDDIDNSLRSMRADTQNSKDNLPF